MTKRINKHTPISFAGEQDHADALPGFDMDESSWRLLPVLTGTVNERLAWMIRLRWGAIAALAVGTLIAALAFRAAINPWPLLAITAGLAAANVVFWLVNRRAAEPTTWRPLVQGVVDLAVLTLTVNCSGGAASPLVLFYVLYAVLAAALFPPPSWYVHTVLACVLLGGLVAAEYYVPSMSVPEVQAAGAAGIAGVLAVFCTTLVVAALIAGRLAGELRRESAGRQRAIQELLEQERNLSHTTDQIASLIHRAEIGGNFDIRYENPHLTPCWVMKNCSREVCPAYGAGNLRCWQEARHYCLQARPNRDGVPGCVDCKVYQAARPDKLTAIGESFNNMMCFLERHAGEAAELQKQIMHQEKMAVIGQMAAGVAHEIGNPLASISSLVQYLMRKSEAALLHDNLALVNSHIERISRIVRDMVNFARPMNAEETPLDVNKMISQALNIASYDKRSQQVEIEQSLSEGLPEVHASSDQLMQVFVNIISNALDALADGGRLRVSTVEVDNYVRISFADNGIGMTREEMEHIFEPFFTTKEVGQGTGLGLSVTDAIVRKLNGRIEVESAKGEGATFHVYLPIGQSGEARQADSPEYETALREKGPASPGDGTDS